MNHGTATKKTLNFLGTTAMILEGKVRGGFMIDFDPNNAKLHRRALRILQTLTGQPEDRCQKALEENHKQLARAIVELESEISIPMNFRITLRPVVCAAVTAMAFAESEIPAAVKSEPTPESMLSKGISPITGTFIQEWLFERFTDERWDQELEHWKKLGIEYVIVGDGAMIDLKDNFRIDNSYPSKIPGAKAGKDVLGKLFEKCAQHRIKVFIGMGNT